MKARAGAWALAVLALAALPAHADLAEIKTRGSLRVVVSADEQAEMYALNPEVAPGFDREILDGFASLQRVRVETVVRPFDDIIGALLKGQGDVVVGLVDTEARRRQISFSVEVLPTRLVVLTCKPQPAIRKIEELRAARVGVVKGTSWVDAVSAAGVPPAQTELVPDLGEALAGLKANRFAATVVSLVDASLAIRKDPALQAGLYLGAPGRAAYAARKDAPELLRALDEYIGNLQKTGTWSRLVVKYFGSDALAVLGRAKQ
jgi:ABC-type amino acid transport substrate-binding protein